MALQFVLGTNSYDHQKKMVEILKSQKKKYPNDKFFYLVPNHIKFESEIEILKELSNPKKNVSAQTNIQILSLPRLAWYFLRTTSVYQKQRISPAGINMLLYQIIIDKKNDLFLFNREAELPGFLSQIAKQISIMKDGNVTADDLIKINQNKKSGITNDLQDKIHDFSIIYSEYTRRIESKYFDQTNVLNLLSDYLENHDMSRYHFFISGFSRFSGQENRLVKTLIQYSASTTIALILNREYTNGLPAKENLFFKTAKLFNDLYRFAQNNHIKCLYSIKVNKLRVSPNISKLEKYWVQSTNFGRISADKNISSNAIRIYQTDNLYSELDQVATNIRHMVASGKYRYSDFLILTRNLDMYENIFDPVFQNQEIPYFKDILKSMSNHPLVELIRSIFDIYNPERKVNYRYDDVMRFLKTELVIPFDPNNKGVYISLDDYRRDVWLTENLVLKNGYQGNKWTQKEDWPYIWASNEDEDYVLTKQDLKATKRVNLIRHLIRDSLPKFYKCFYQAKTNKEAAGILYKFLQNNGVIKRLKEQRNMAVKAANITHSDEIEQVWKTFCLLLDESVQILGDKPFIAQDFWNLLYAGFEGSNYSQIPSTLDQVMISETGAYQMKNRKVVFMIGSNDENMPERMENSNIFGDDDIIQISRNLNNDKYLNDPSDQLMAQEPFLNYLAFTAGKEKLIFTYTKNTKGDLPVDISPYVRRIQEYFGLHIIDKPTIPDNNQKSVISYVGSKRSTLHHLIQVIQANYHKEDLNSSWVYIYKQLKNDPNFNNLTQTLLNSIKYKNTPHNLDPHIVEQLYGPLLNISISQLESFFKDPYEYFLKYGLKLQEREEFELSSASTGQFFHEALDHINKQIHRDKIDLAHLSKNGIKKLVSKNVSNIINDPDNFQYVILSSSYRMSYITKQLKSTIEQMVQAMQSQQKFTSMKPQKTELVFGPHEKLKGLSFDLPHNKRVNVKGRIDRIDSMKVSNKDYFGIIDYKSGNWGFDFSQAYYGTSMQLLTYLDVLKHNISKLKNTSKPASLVGALYLHILNATLRYKDLKKKKLEEALLKKHKYQGILVDNPKLIKGLDKSLIKRTGPSLVYPFYKTKNGELSNKKSNIIQEDNLDAFLKHTEELIIQASKDIYNGDILMKPYKKLGKQTPFKYSPYKAIMNFDPLLPENEYEKEHRLSKKEIIDKLKNKRKESK